MALGRGWTEGKILWGTTWPEPEDVRAAALEAATSTTARQRTTDGRLTKIR